MGETKNYTEDEIMSALSTCLDITDGTKCCDNCVFNGQPACTCDLFQEVVDLVKSKDTIIEFQSKNIKNLVVEQHEMFSFLKEFKLKEIAKDAINKTLGENNG